MTRLKSWQLFAICVGVWGTTWYAITFQIGLIAPEVGVALRFGLAGATTLAWCRLRRMPLGFAWRDLGLLALQGSFMYGVAYVCVYHAEKYLVSGVVAVGYSAAPLLSGLGAWALFGLALSRRFIVGGVFGVLGVALIFWPELAQTRGGENAALGALFTVGSVGLSAAGSLAASRNRSRGMPFWPSLGWGMIFGALVSAAIALMQGESFALPTPASWWLSLFYLAWAGSILTFASFLTLQDRLGPGPTGAVGVMTPMLALVISLLLESYRPSLLTALGAALAVLGNVLMLKAEAAKTAVA